MSFKRSSVKIKDLLDFSSLLGSSISPDNERPRSTATVHHRPPHYIPKSHTDRSPSTGQKREIHVKKEKDLNNNFIKCPNVVVRDGIICMPYRETVKKEDEVKMSTDRRCNRRDRGRKELLKGDKEQRNKDICRSERSKKLRGSIQATSPQLDTSLTSKQLATKRLLAKKLLRLKKLALQNHSMELVLPQQYLGDLSPLVPSEDSLLFSGIFSSASMYDGMPYVNGMSDHLTLDDDAIIKSDFASLDGNEDIRGLENGFSEHITAPIGSDDDLFRDSWMTTSVSLPLTPDEPLENTPYPTHQGPLENSSFHMPNEPLGNTPYPTSMVSIQSPFSAQHAHLPGSPLTPESQVSPSSNSEELEDVLSYFNDTATFSYDDGFDQFVSTSPVDSSTVAVCENDGNSVYSPYTSMASSPTSAVQSPLSHPAVTMTTVTPGETIRDILIRESSTFSLTEQHHFNDVPHPQNPSQAVSNPSSVGIKSRKRNSSEAGISVDDSGSKIPSRAGSGSKISSWAGSASRSKRRVKGTTRKERKREQNKTAALRYRQKKKEEKQVIDEKEHEMEAKNNELKAKISSLEAEIHYLSKLWSEIQDAKKKRVQ